MRRSLSILLVLIFGLGPLSSTLEASEDLRVPACCRRHGAHHCAMSSRMAERIAESGETILTAPATCSSYPDSSAATISVSPALTAASVSLAGLFAEARTHSADRATVLVSQISTRAGRGPPAAILS